MNHAEKRERRTFRKGQTLVEYALVLALISFVVISVMLNMGKQLNGLYSSMTSKITTSISSAEGS